MDHRGGILYGPWLSIYGIGALGIYAMKPVKKHPVLLFFLCALVTGIVEYIIGYIGIRYFGMRLWDYRELLCNRQGRGLSKSCRPAPFELYAWYCC